MKKSLYNKILLIIVIIMVNGLFHLLGHPSFAANIEGTKTYEDYIFILVHGIKAHEDIYWKGEFGNLKKYLENGMGLKGRVFAYSFKDVNGPNMTAVQEFGNRNQYNDASYKDIDENGNLITRSMNGKCWLEKAKEDFIQKNPGKAIPSKYIIISHSMSNLAVRSYIYSEKVFGKGKGFYNDDIAKVVFIAPPLLGSDMVVASWKLQYDLMTSSMAFFTKNGIGEPLNLSEVIQGFISGTLEDPKGLYMLAAWIVTADIYGEQTIKDCFGWNTLKPTFGGMWDMLPHSPLVMALKDAELADPTMEPAYSIVYGRGIPVYDAYSSMSAAGIKWLNDSSAQQAFAEEAATRGYDYFDSSGRLYSNLLGQTIALDYKWLTLAHPGFWALPTAQSKFMSFLQANALSGFGFFTNDGDGLVPTYSAKGEGIKHLSNAPKYDYIFKTDPFENYLSNTFPIEIAGVEGAIAVASSLSGLPHYVFWPLRFAVAVHIVIETHDNIDGLRNNLKAHGAILEQYDLIRTAILDTPAVFTVNDLQAFASGESGGSPEATALSFSVGASVPSGFESVKVKSVTENRAAIGTISLPVPMTLKIATATGEGERKYVTQMTLTKPPSRIAGKLNYLVPKLMKKFEYSFNYAAWKPIEGVNPETGEFVLENLPFAEGQNVIAVRAENAVGIKSSQILKIVLNTIPLLPSQFQPMPNYYISDTNPTISIEFNKSEYTGDYESEKITIKEMMVDGEIVTPQVESTMESYHPWAKASYKVPSDKPLDEGEHQIAVKAESNVGVAQGLWSFYVDRSPPVISMEAIAPYSARAPTTIRYNASDEVSPNLLAVRCDLYDSKDNFITNIATVDAMSKGDNFFTLDPSKLSVPIPDGNYKIKIKAFDLAGNSAVAEQPITIDSTPPIIAGIDITPNPMTSKTKELGLTARVNEKSTIIIKLNNTSNKSTTAYLTQASSASDSFLASYTWKYDDIFMKGPKDGIYRVEVIARDEADNESAPRTLEAVRIDRTPPKIYGQIANPYVLSNIGANAYQTNLSYRLSDASKVKIKIYNSCTGAQVDEIPAPPCLNTNENNAHWNGSNPTKFPKGAYRFQIIAEDDVGNVGIAYASCVKDGIAPAISFPAEDNDEVTGTIAIRGTAIDPDWTNDKPFKQYRVYYKKSNESELKSDFIEVPQVNRDPKDPKNVSVRPLQNNSTLAYLYANALENGDYTILVVVDEDGGQSLSTTRAIKVNNDPMAASSIQSPYVELKPRPSGVVEFKPDDSVKLPIGFINSVKPANVYVEVIKTGSLETPVFFKYFPNILGAPFIGKPDYKAGSDLGYFLWSDDNGYHLRWSADGSNHKFTGSIILVGSGSYLDVKQVGGGIKVQSPLISWDTSLLGGEGGIDFKLNSGQLMITAKIDEDPTSPSITADNVYLGVSKFTQQYLPIIIDVAGQRLVDVSSMGKAAESSNLERATQTIEWNGKYDTGAYVDNGLYLVRVRAEGVDGMGVATDEAFINITTPFNLSVKEVTPANREFSTLGGIDRISVFYNVSKDSIVNAYVYDKNDTSGRSLATLAEGKEVLGTTNPNNPLSLVWKGNYPDADSGQVVTGGSYKILLNVAAKDGSGSEPVEIDGISITKYFHDSSINLNPIGEEIDFNNGNSLEKMRLASGDSPFYYEAKGTGWYHPPRDFSYTLTATGEQRITAYPYVPFAALMHRRFNKVRITAKTGAEGVYADSVWSLGWKRGDSFSFSKPRTSHNYTLTTDSETTDSDSFELSDSAGSDDLFGSPTGLNQPSRAFVKLEIPITFYAQDDDTFILDTVTIHDDDFTDGTGEARSRPSDKGIFNVTFLQDPSPPQPFTFMGHTYSIKAQYNQRVDEFHYKYKIKVELASTIPYSRLTNRFFPWIGFVNAKNGAHEKNDFSGYLNDLDKLGFPGKSYFMGASAQATDAPHKGSFGTELLLSNPGALTSNLKVGGQDVPKPEITKLNNAVSSKMTGTASDYTTYLSDETLEFIPITFPYKGYFEYGSSRVTDKLALNKQSSYAFIAKTDLTYPYNGEGGAISPFVFSWPWNESEKTAFKTQQAVKRATLDKDLGGNPQNYTGPTWDQKTGTGGTWWELEEDQINQRKAEQRTSRTSTGQVRFDKSVSKSTWSTTESFGQFLPLPNYVDEAQYTVVSNTTDISVSPTSGSTNDKLSAKDADTMGISWTTANDLNLIPSKGVIRSASLTFNDKEYKGKRTLYVSSGKENEALSGIESLAYQLNQNDYTSANALKYTFLKYDPFTRDRNNTPVDNPNVVIDNWEVKVKDKTGNENKDIILLGYPQKNDKRLHDTFTLKLKLDASESRYVEILGKATVPYELMYFDGNTWKTFYSADHDDSSRLGWWNVSRLNGKYTVLLRSSSGNFISTQDIQIGTLVKKGGGDAYSTYKRAQLKFPAGSFVNGSKLPQDQLVTITPVSMQEIYIRNRPIIITTGPIVEIKPSPWKFTVSSAEGVDQRPTLRFVYTFEDLADPKLGLWDMSKPLPDKGDNLNLQMNIHQVTAAGDLQIVNGNRQEVEINNGEYQYAFYAPLNHFSTYALLPGKFSLSAPIVYADRYITNKNTVTIYGTAEPKSILNVYVKKENTLPDTSKGDKSLAEISAEAKTGNYKFENVRLLPEDGENYIFVTSHQEGNRDVRTWSDVTIIKDTVPPSAEARPNLYAFSPNGDGKYDSVDFILKSNERGGIFLQLTANGFPFFNQEISAEAEKEIKLTWTKDGVNLYRRDLSTGGWLLVNSYPLSEKLADGAYHAIVYAIDEAGNISNNIISQTVVDTTPPTVLGLNADPNPFTPNDDGVKDTTKFWYKFSEPAYATLSIYRDDKKLFRKHEGATENFVYPTLPTAYPILPTSTGDWQWDGRGSRNEMLGGTYAWLIKAEDWVGNVTSSEVKQIVVDREPTLIPYAYAEPDPFSPVNPNNSFTEIKYYLSRDNLKVSAAVVGEGNLSIKTLINNEIQGKGEHSVRWYGDFNTDYEGPTAQKNRYRVFDGSYEFQVKAVDPDGGNPANVTNTVLIDNVAPAITTKPIQVDYAKKQATLKYTLPENATIEVKVFDLDGNLILTAAAAEAKLAGEYTVIYEEPSRPVGTGSEYFKLRAVDRALNESEVTTEAFAVVANLFQIASHQAIPATFTPNGDSRNDQTRISYNISGGVAPYTVSVTILNPAGATVKRLIENESQSAGTWSFYWDGKADSGQWTSDGNYEYQIIATDSLGTKVEGRGPLLLISTRPTVDISTSLPIFSPNGDSSKDMVTFNYSINYPTFYITGEALVKLDVLNASGETVWSKVFNHTAGSYVYEYNGLTADGLPLTAGNHYVKISGEDALGSTAVPKTVNLAVDYEIPAVAIQSIAPNPFSPFPNGVQDQTVISYTLAKPAYVTVKVKQEEAVIKTLQADQWNEAYVPISGLSASKVKSFGIPTVTWDGKNDAGSFVADGSYSIEISAIDSAGNPSSVSQAVVIDNTEPAVPMADSLPANTNQGLQNITGSAEPNSRVEVFVNDSLVSFGNASTSGTFNLPTNLFAGANQIKLTATDTAGNTSDFSMVQLVNYETDAPIISNLLIIPNPAKAGPITITFTVSETLESDPIVKINEKTAPTCRGRFPNLTIWQYEYTYNVTNSDRQGAATISIEARDLAGNQTAYQANNLLTIDTVNAAVSNVDIDVVGNPRGSGQTAYAKLGSKVMIDFSASEPLLSDPIVCIGNTLTSATQENKTVYSPSRIDYSYSYTVANNNVNGTTLISIEVTDLAGNISIYSFNNSLIVDKASPEVSNLAVTPNPATIPSVNGQVSIKFNVSEPLKEAPKAYVTQNGATPQLITVSGLWSSVFGLCEAKYDVVSGYDGPALITIEAIDLANNLTTYRPIGLFTIDTVKPVFSNIQSEIGSNPEFTKYAREESEVKIMFRASEPLKFNPEVKVNGNLASYDGLISNEYAYKYIVSSLDSNGTAEVSIAGYDFAGNEGAYSTKQLAESFVIDLVIPTVEVGKRQDNPNEDLIADPQMFATNADPAGRHGEHLKTWLHYRLVEDSKVTLTIHKMSNSSQAPYRKEDFSDTNKVKTLINGLWQMKGQHDDASWEGIKDDGTYAEPGKYAFIVKAQDYAGNTSWIKYGGTFWIQDNVLKLRAPEQLEFEREGIQVGGNPDPLFISPFGNSTEPKQKRARLYFRIDLGITPKTLAPSEWIVAMGAEDDISWEANARKVVGTYQVKVYSEAGGLVWTSPTSEAESGRILWIDWGGTNEAGQQVANGKYKMVVEIKDFRGQSAMTADGLAYERWVTVDNEKPTVSNLSAAPYYFAPGNTTSSIKTTTLTYEVYDNNNSSEVMVEVYKGNNLVKTLVNGAWKSNGSYQRVWAGGGPSGYVGTANGSNFTDGIYTFVVSAVDQAGNSSNTGSKEVFVDTVNPQALQPSAITPTNEVRPIWSWSKANDPSPSSSLEGYYVKIGTTFTGNDILSETWIGTASLYRPVNSLSEDEYYLSLKAKDKAGNVSSYNCGSAVNIDLTKPQSSVTGLPQYTTGSTSFTVAWSGQDYGNPASGIKSYDVQYRQYITSWSAWTDWQVDKTTTSAIFNGVNGRRYQFRSRARDKAGMVEDYPSTADTATWVDITPPSTAVTALSTYKTTASFTVSWGGSDNSTGIGSYDVQYKIGSGGSWANWLIGTTNTSATFNGSDGNTYYFQSRARDNAGNLESYPGGNGDTYTTVDISSPYVSDLPAVVDDNFNPYTETNTTVNFTVYDSISGLSSLTARIKYGSNTVKDLTITSSGNNRSITWDGTNNANPPDYENEGDYTLEITATDNAGNPARVETSTISLRDDQRITNDSTNPSSLYLNMDGNYLGLRWIEGAPFVSAMLTQEASFSRGWALGGSDDERYSYPFYIDIRQQVTVTSYAWGEYGEEHSIRSYPSNVGVWTRPSGTGDDYVDDLVYLNPGWYRAYVRVLISGGTGGGGSTSVRYTDYKYNQYASTSANLGQSWGAAIGPTIVDSYSIGQTSDTYDKTYWHNVYVSNGNLYYQRCAYGSQPTFSIKITNSGSASNPIIREDANHNAYVAWVDGRNGNNEVYFQKIPFNFAPVKGTNIGPMSVKPITSLVLNQSITLEAPTLFAPEKDKQNVESIRPTFEWKHHKGAVNEYKIDVAKNDAFSIDHQTFNKSANTGSLDKTDQNLYYFNYSIHEFDPGLDRDTYYWKVTALTTNEAATSEVWSFKIQPDLTLTGITNYPNPFNPNRERTKIRYRLSTDADNVKIRIYDITGSLVNELEGSTNGESANIWAKYNDIEWDGRNGRGSIVLNGIYPFEVMARLGDKSISGRGKIAVLK